MLLARRRSWRIAGLALTVALWPGLAVAQAQVEAVPEPPPFDMWDLDAINDSAVGLPDEPVPPPGPITVGQPPDTDANDACRHFTEEERRLLPSLCGPSD